MSKVCERKRTRCRDKLGRFAPPKRDSLARRMLGSREETEEEAECAAPGAANVKSTRPRKRKADVAIYLHDVDQDVGDTTKKKKQRECEASWSSSEDDCAYASPRRWTSTLEHDDARRQQITLINAGFPHYNLTNVFATPVRSAPLPTLCWACKDAVWNNMLAKDRTYVRNVNMMDKHPHLQPKMRAILLDWLMEVSEVYKLHRETYHLAQDYFDRFMATQTNVFKSMLQLIGISCLFIAAKFEEMYPPKVHEFAYVTDQACTEDEILSMEIIIMKELKWSLSPQTPVSWLNVYMQVAYLKESDRPLIPKYPQDTFAHIAELLDVCMLDMRCLEFSNGVLAASALFHFSSLELVENVSALKRAELEECVRWMVPFAVALRESGGSPVKTFAGVAAEDMHNIQTHAPYLTWMEKASSYPDSDLERHRDCRVPYGVLTPPLSSEKADDDDEGDAAPPAEPQVRARVCAAEWTQTL